MTTRVAPGLGVMLVAAHALAFWSLARTPADRFAVDVLGPSAAPTPSLTGVVPPAFASRTTHATDGDGPGLQRQRWAIGYRGGYRREVGAAQLVGPFQDAAAHACSGRIVIGQPLLDDVTPVFAAELTKNLEGSGAFPIGDFQRVRGLRLQWAERAARPVDHGMVPASVPGYLRATFTVVFQRVSVPMVIALVPVLGPRGLTFTIRSRAELSFGNRWIDWASDHLGGDRLATMLAHREIAQVVIEALAPPPPLAYAPGRTIAFDYCGAPPTFADAAFATLPFAVVFQLDIPGLGGRVRVDRQAGVRPPAIAALPRVVTPPRSAIALDLGVDALDALLFELWRSDFLDEQLALAGLDRQFNADPTVQALLSLRAGPPMLALPPVVRVRGTGAKASLVLAADARLALVDGPITTPARLWTELALTTRLTTTRTGPSVTGVAVAAAELACEPTPGHLEPCYADILAAVRDRQAAFDGALTDAFAHLVDRLFVGQAVGDDTLPAALRLDGAAPRLVTTPGGGGFLRVDLEARIAPPR